MNNPIPYNSAYSSVNTVANMNLTGRLQWVGIEGAPKSFLLNGSMPFEKINASGGLIIKQDKFSVENQTALNVFFTKSVQVTSNHYLAVSISGGFQNYIADYSQLDPTDPQFRDDIRESSGTIGTGLLFYQPDKFYAGISLPNLNLKSFNQASYRTKNSFYFSGGYLQDLGNNIMVKPAVMASYLKNTPLTADLSTTLYFGTLGIGLNYRTTNDIGGILSYLINNFRIGYSYQAGLGSKNIGSMSTGTHELSLGIYFGKKVTNVQL
jgi:type IX secretion system PorP/SprF family membrane protein